MGMSFLGYSKCNTYIKPNNSTNASANLGRPLTTISSFITTDALRAEEDCTSSVVSEHPVSNRRHFNIASVF